MGCSNCFNGCLDIVSDKCIKYTGLSIVSLGIANGDSLSAVENAITTNLVAALDGSGIKLNIDPEIICTTISQYIPTNVDTTLVYLATAIIKGVCDLQTEITAISAIVDAYDAPYTVGCLENVFDSSPTHDVVQELIDEICALKVTVTALQQEILTQYVAVADINTYIATYIATH